MQALWLLDNQFFWCCFYFAECQNPSFNNSWYIFSKQEETWNVSQRKCRSQGGDLVSIETEEEWMFINKEIRNRIPKFYHIGLVKKADKWTWLSGRPLTICQRRKNQLTRKRNVAVIQSTIDNECNIDYLDSYEWAAYICEVSNGKTEPLLFHIGWDNNIVIKQTFRHACDHYRWYEASNNASFHV